MLAVEYDDDGIPKDLKPSLILTFLNKLDAYKMSQPAEKDKMLLLPAVAKDYMDFIETFEEMRLVPKDPDDPGSEKVPLLSYGTLNPERAQDRKKMHGTFAPAFVGHIAFAPSIRFEGPRFSQAALNALKPSSMAQHFADSFASKLPVSTSQTAFTGTGTVMNRSLRDGGTFWPQSAADTRAFNCVHTVNWLASFFTEHSSSGGVRYTRIAASFPAMLADSNPCN